MLKKTLHLILLVALLVALGGLLAACGGDDNSDKGNEEKSPYAGKKVLWIDSYHAEYEGSVLMASGVNAALADTGVELKIAYLDTKRVTADDEIKAIAEKIKAEVDAFKPDVVIATDDNAHKYVVIPYTLYDQVPVVFGGVNWDAGRYGYPLPNVTGMIEVDLAQQLVELMRAYAKGDRLGYVAIDTETERTTSDWYNQLFFNGEMQVQLVPTLAELKDTFLAMQADVDMIIFGNNAGAPDWNDEEASAFFAANTKVPTGGVQAWMYPFVLINLGKNATEWGSYAAQTALQILAGTKPADIPITQNKEGHLTVNLDIAETLGVVFDPATLKAAETYSAEPSN